MLRTGDVEIERADAPFTAEQSAFPAAPKWAYAFGPESNASFVAVARLQASSVPVFRTDAAQTAAAHEYAPGTWLVPATAESRRILEAVAKETGLVVSGLDQPLPVSGFRLKPGTRIGLWRGA